MKKSQKVLAVDLDGTLLKTDMLYESLCYSISENILNTFVKIKYFLINKAKGKREFAKELDFDPAILPYRGEVLEFITKAKQDGCRTVLVSASDNRLVEKISDFLGCFDEAFGSDGKTNLKGKTKAEFLINRFGEKGFDYIGDSKADLHVWAKADRVLTVNASRRLKTIFKENGQNYTEVVFLDSWILRLKTLFFALRPHQWLKNLLVFLPIFAAHNTEVTVLAIGLVAFISFCFITSSVYLFNDLLDLDSDRRHSWKKKRPFASGDMSITFGLVNIIFFLLLGLVIGWFVGQAFLWAIMGYYCLTLLYSLELKRKFIIDIFVLAAFFIVRVVAGSLASGIELSIWLLAFCGFLFLSLATIKRQAELSNSLNQGKQKALGRAYTVEDLPVVGFMAFSMGLISVIIFMLYLLSPSVTMSYSEPIFLWGACPVLLCWIIRLALLARNGEMHEDPVMFAARDKNSLACGILIFLFIVAGI